MNLPEGNKSNYSNLNAFLLAEGFIKRPGGSLLGVCATMPFPALLRLPGNLFRLKR